MIQIQVTEKHAGHGVAHFIAEEKELSISDSDADDDAAPAMVTEPVRDSVYDKIARLAGEPDYETYWERHFEQLRGEGTYSNAAHAYGQELRSLEDFSARSAAENLVREAYMRRKIQQAMAEGFKPEQIVVATGAFHATSNTWEAPIQIPKARV